VKHSILLLTLSFFINHHNIVLAQSTVYDFEMIKGKTIDDSTNQGIPSSNLYNESKRSWDYANENGEFNLWANIGDTIVISAIGYLSEVIILDSTILNNSLLIRLQARTYEIGEAVIKAPKTYSKFKQDLLNLDLPRTELDSVTEELAITSKQVIKKAEYDRMVNEVFNREKGTLFVLGTSIDRKQQKEAKKINDTKTLIKNQHKISKRYNREIVKKYTHLEDQELTEFISFCNFSNEFLLKSSEYEIIKAILAKLKEYKQKNIQSD